LSAVRIVIFAKAPIAGLAKTRLIPALGAERAAQLARRMLLHTLREACKADVGPVEMCVTPGLADPAWTSLPPIGGILRTEQPQGDLGIRLAKRTARAIEAGEQVLLVGTDCPQLDARRLQQAAALLSHSDSVLLPTFDGGYALLGLQRFHHEVFDRIPWSTAEVAAVTCERIRRLGWSLSIGSVLHDIDEPGDLQWLPESWSDFRNEGHRLRRRAGP
jgi:rSAM/selenodomain-associated transferase 1